MCIVVSQVSPLWSVVTLSRFLLLFRSPFAASSEQHGSRALNYLGIGESLSQVRIKARQGVQLLCSRAINYKADRPEVVVVAKDEDHGLVERSIPYLFRCEQKATLEQETRERGGGGRGAGVRRALLNATGRNNSRRDQKRTSDKYAVFEVGYNAAQWRGRLPRNACFADGCWEKKTQCLFVRGLKHKIQSRPCTRYKYAYSFVLALLYLLV